MLLKVVRLQFKCGYNSKNISKALNLRLQFESGYNSCAAVNGAVTVLKNFKYYYINVLKKQDKKKVFANLVTNPVGSKFPNIIAKSYL